MAEVDIIKYKQLADSMAEAFGVQQELELESIPKGTSVVSTEFAQAFLMRPSSTLNPAGDHGSR